MEFEMLKFGRKAVDTVTGLEGKITGFAKYMTGCNQYALESCENNEIKATWIDEQRVKYVGDMTKKIVQKKTGGPQRTPPSRH